MVRAPFGCRAVAGQRAAGHGSTARGAGRGRTAPGGGEAGQDRTAPGGGEAGRGGAGRGQGRTGRGPHPSVNGPPSAVGPGCDGLWLVSLVTMIRL